MTAEIDPVLLAAEIGEAVQTFNRLTNLAGEAGLVVQAEILLQSMIDQPRPRPVLSVNVVQPLCQ